jgi:hypothetical protein
MGVVNWNEWRNMDCHVCSSCTFQSEKLKSEIRWKVTKAIPRKCLLNRNILTSLIIDNDHDHGDDDEERERTCSFIF